MRVVIMGCGRVGSSLAHALDSTGHAVAVVDREESAFRRLNPSFGGTTVRGVGFDRDVLEAAGIAEADAFAAVSSGDNSNIIAARVARETFGVDRVVARIYDAKRAAVYERLGIPTVATVPWTTQRFVAALGVGDAATAWRDPSGSVLVTQIVVHESWIGQSAKVFQEETGARIAFIIRVGTAVLPEPRTVLQQDDTVYVAVLRERRDAAVAVAGARREAAE